MQTKWIYLSILPLLLIQCTRDDITTLDTQTPVIEGYLIAGAPLDSVRITLSYSYARADTNLITLDDLPVRVYSGDRETMLIPIGSGYYQDTTFIIEATHSYNIEFEWNGETIRAQTYVPEMKTAVISQDEIAVQQIAAGSFPNPGSIEVDPVEVTWDNTEGDYYYVVIENTAEDPEYINERFAEFENGNGGPGRFRMISRPQITDFYAINAFRDLTQFGLHRVVIFRVNPEYAALYELSSTSTQNITQPPTNVENGLGIWTGISSDTVYLNVVKK
ncbi:MAG: DUF4249 family protein [Saprospiraceae bacterium]|nr:DUF4249 family protein [Saprospiraceae bacterium]HPG07145.1 DUF4249 family protein [Saprospiraceae bacterium]